MCDYRLISRDMLRHYLQQAFLCIKNAQRGAIRFTSLLKQFGLEDRLIHSHEELPGKIHLLRFRDEDAVSLKKRSLQQRALDWLQTNLSNPRKPRKRASGADKNFPAGHPLGSCV
jgi:hypothetical protein